MRGPSHSGARPSTKSGSEVRADDLADLLADGFESTPKLSRSEQNRRNRQTAGGITGHPLYDVCRHVLRAGDEELCEEWWDLAAFIAGVEREVGNRPTSRHILRPLIEDEGFIRGNLVWVERSATARELREVARMQELYGDCGCRIELIPDCGCVLALTAFIEDDPAEG